MTEMFCALCGIVAFALVRVVRSKRGTEETWRCTRCGVVEHRIRTR